MESNGTTYPVVVLNNGVVVMARDDGPHGLRARLYTNRTQAQHMADRIGGTVYQPRFGPAFYVEPPLPKQEPLPISGGSDAPLRIAVVVEGGVVQDVIVEGPPAVVAILDYDDMDEESVASLRALAGLQGVDTWDDGLRTMSGSGDLSEALKTYREKAAEIHAWRKDEEE